MLLGLKKTPQSSQQSPMPFSLCPHCTLCLLPILTSVGHNQKKTSYQNPSPPSRLILMSFLSSCINQLWSLPVSFMSSNICLILLCARHCSKYSSLSYHLSKVYLKIICLFTYLISCLFYICSFSKYLFYGHFSTTIRVLSLNFREWKHQSQGHRKKTSLATRSAANG